MGHSGTQYNTRMIKKILIISLITGTLLLTGCGGDDEETTPTDNQAPPVEQLAFYRLVEASDFSIQVSEEWETISHFTSAFPDNTIVAFRNNNKDNEFVANINIVRNEVPEGTITADYALEMFETVSGQLIDFKKLDEQPIDLIVGNTTEPSYVFEFEGTNDGKNRTRGFMQTYGVKGTKAYVVTGTYALSDSEISIDQVKQSVPTFMLR